MASRISALLTVALLSVLLAGLVSLAQQIPAPAQQKKRTQSPASAATRDRGDQSDQQEIERLKADIQRMQTILYQMRTNLGFVGNTTTPLYHEFELEIDMWGIEIDQLDRRLKRLEGRKG